jgi:hypothetical protein
MVHVVSKKVGKYICPELIVKKLGGFTDEQTDTDGNVIS